MPNNGLLLFFRKVTYFSIGNLESGSFIIQAALGIQSPWFIKEIDLKQESHELHIYLDFEKGSEFPWPTCNSPCKCYDTKNKVWQHLTFFQYRTYIHASLPRVSCDQHGVHLVEVPWARQGTGFTLLLEAFLLTLSKESTIKGIQEITSIGIDETSKKRGHNYVTLSVDM